MPHSWGLTQEHMRALQLQLLNERKLAVETVAARITALRFFCVKVLHRGRINNWI
jgi:hypothetical protein